MISLPRPSYPGPSGPWVPFSQDGGKGELRHGMAGRVSGEAVRGLTGQLRELGPPSVGEGGVWTGIGPTPAPLHPQPVLISVYLVFFVPLSSAALGRNRTRGLTRLLGPEITHTFSSDTGPGWPRPTSLGWPASTQPPYLISHSHLAPSRVRVENNQSDTKYYNIIITAEPGLLGMSESLDELDRDEEDLHSKW